MDQRGVEAIGVLIFYVRIRLFGEAHPDKLGYAKETCPFMRREDMMHLFEKDAHALFLFAEGGSRKSVRT